MQLKFPNNKGKQTVQTTTLLTLNSQLLILHRFPEVSNAHTTVFSWSQLRESQTRADKDCGTIMLWSFYLRSKCLRSRKVVLVQAARKNCAVSVTLHAIKFKIILLVLEYLIEHQTRFHLHWLVVSCLGSHLFFVTSPNLEIVNIPAALILIEVRSSALKPTRRPANWPLSRWQKLNGASARSSEPNGDFPCKHNENISTLIKTKIAPAVEKQSFKHHMQNNSSGYNNLLL